MNFFKSKLNRNGTPTPIGERPEFYLVYLAFYFFPWLFQTPAIKDVLAAIIAIVIFIPIYFHGFKQTDANALRHVVAVSLIGFATSPFLGSHGVFHIYAVVQAGFIRPERTAWITAIVLTLVYSMFSILTNQTWWDLSFPVFMGLITLVGVISSAGQIEKNAQLERSRSLEQHMATISERERIAQDLHDLLGQTLTMVALKSEVATRLFDSKPEQAKQELLEIRNAARVALSDVREAVAGMNTTSLRAELKRAEQVLSTANIKLHIIGLIPSLNAEADQVLGLSVREAMTNIVRHSVAKQATFSISDDGSNVIVSVEDDGASDSIIEGSGITGLRKRLQKFGGVTRIEQTPGLKISMQIPSSNINQ